MRDAIEQLFFHLSGPHDTGRVHHLHRRGVVRPTGSRGRIERTNDRLGKGIAHDGEVGDGLGLHQTEQFVGVERAVLHRRHQTTSELRDERTDPHAGAVHQWRARNRTDAVVGGDCGFHQPGNLSGIGGRRDADERVPGDDEPTGHTAHGIHDALGHTRGATGEEHVDVVFGAGDARHRVVPGEHILVRQRTRHLAGVAVVVFHQQLQLRQAVDHPRHSVAER